MQAALSILKKLDMPAYTHARVHGPGVVRKVMWIVNARSCTYHAASAFGTDVAFVDAVAAQDKCRRKLCPPKTLRKQKPRSK